MTLADYVKSARELLSAARSNNATARQQLRAYFPSTHYWSPIQAKYVVAREAGFTGWPALRRACAERK